MAGLLTNREHGRLLLTLKRLHFPERTTRRLLNLAAERLPAERVAALAAWLQRDEANAKRQDALALLDAVAAGSSAQRRDGNEKDPGAISRNWGLT